MMEGKEEVADYNNNFKTKGKGQGKNVCVTGASGFLASWLVKRLLLSGYRVIGTVRDPGEEKKVGHLWKLEGAKERLKLVKADLSEEGSFDDAINGCQGVFHTASPVLATPNLWYPLSKTMAERAASEFCKENNIHLVTVLPTFIIGPSLPPQLCSTATDFLGLLKGETEKFQLHGRMGYVYIDDVAASHILVYEHESAQGRYLCNSNVIELPELASILSTLYPTLPISKRFVKHNDRPYYELDTSKLKSLGMKFKSVEETFDETVKSLIEQGHLSPQKLPSYT
ncbi:unnamed protein product [Cuscuta epithymum]|uniref:NAD-dependent epimerase/dehydratase domain-containing protein n=1 Tax=Cuscuta epithymum TaxID=186058 RepID=A0AAV0G914_9ASTE|nr:unnamed protein product [Cuscuta epithymum]CAH9144336.1 unnamed protein product [Cuscuta epithymum]